MASNRVFLPLSLCLLACLQVTSFARPVSLEKAKEQATAFFASTRIATRASLDNLELTTTFPKIETRSNYREPAMYVFSVKSGGFVIIAGDDAARPVLAFSLEHPFVEEGMPDNLRYLLDWYSDVIEYASCNNLETRSDTSSLHFDPTKSVQLKTAKWAQMSPFNDLAPEIDGQKPPIGCVATAISIIMKYHRWPIRGTGTLPSYSTQKLQIKGYDLGHEYKWDKMLDDFKECDEEGRANIARLLYDVAVMLHMNFNLSGSGSILNLALLLPIYFGYDPGINYQYRCFPDRKWEAIISKEIDAGRPVLYGGGDGMAAHAMVIDGYNGRYFSFNFGTGWEFGYYTLSPIDGNPDGLVQYYSGQIIVVNIKPDEGGKGTFFPFASGENPIPDGFEKNKRISLEHDVNNNSYLGGDLEVGYVLYDRNDHVKEEISKSTRVVFADLANDKNAMAASTFGRSVHVNLECHVTKSIEEGDMIALSAKDPDTGKWAPISQDRSSMIVFTTRPLAELVQLGCSDLEYLFEGTIWGRTTLSLYDSLIWSIREEGNDSPIFGSFNPGTTWLSPLMTQSLVKENIIDRDRILSYIHLLKTGNYVLQCCNPATGEKMVIKLEL